VGEGPHVHNVTVHAWLGTVQSLIDLDRAGVARWILCAFLRSSSIILHVALGGYPRRLIWGVTTSLLCSLKVARVSY